MRLTKYARDMRHQPTHEEAIVWRWLRDRRFGHWKFRRQHPIGSYITDFYCADLKLAIELDGRGHTELATDMYDVTRDCELAKLGVTVIRIANEKVRVEPSATAETFSSPSRNSHPHPAFGHPLPQAGEGTDFGLKHLLLNRLGTITLSS
jgi:very-short-patch-repair endonuclease